MSDKEKLVELLDDIQARGEDFTDYEIYGMRLPDTISNEDVASHLIAHGVTVLPVQVGDTVYGRFSTYGKEVHQCKVVKVKACQFKDRSVRYFLDLEFEIIDPFYRDGRLMRCCMQAIYGEDWGDWYRVYLTREEAEAQPPKGE